MQVFNIRLASLLPLLVSCLIPRLAAAEVWDAAPFSADSAALLASAEALPAEEGVDVQVLLLDGSYRFEEDGSSSVRLHIIYRILTPVGLEGWSSLSMAWQPWHQQRPRMRARVLTPDGSEHWLDPATIDESPVGDASASILSDRLQLRAPLPAAAVGAVVEEEIEVRDIEPSFSDGIVEIFPFGRRVPVRRARLSIDVPEQMPLRHAARLLPDLEVRSEENDGRVRWTFETTSLDAVESVEPLTPGQVPVWPWVSFSTGESWARVAQRYSDVVDAQLAVEKAEEKRLAGIVRKALRGAQGRQEKAARLLAWLQSEVRYTGLEFGEAAIVPRSPAETLSRKYGDCKDKATLLVALLRTAGIPAHLALLNTGPGVDVEPELPGLGTFDHAIVVAPGSAASGDDLWIDPTHEFAAVGELPLVDQGRLALVARSETTELETIPATGPESNRIAETREVLLAADLGGGRVIETTHAWGSIGRALRHSYSRADEADIEEWLTDYMRSTYAAEDLAAWRSSDPRDLTGPFELRVEATGAEVALTDLTSAAVVISLDPLLDRLPDAVLQNEEEEAPASQDGIAGGARKSDLVLLEPYVAEHRYRVVPPPGYRAIDLPEDESRELGPATLTRETSLDDDGVVRLHLRFDTGKRHLTPQEIEALRSGVRELLEEEALLIELEHVGEAHLAAGEVREALVELDRLVEAAPERALPRIRRSRALLSAGLGEAARREARAAVELEPELGLAHNNLGWALQHDLLGRLRHAGFDHTAAVEAYRKAAELDPANEFTRFDLAILLEHDREGARYSPAADLDAAIVEYRAIFEESTDTGYEDNLLLALGRAERFDEMRQLARRLGSTPSRDALSLVATAAADSPAAALKEARRIDGEDPRRQALASGAQVLIQLRRYPEAAELLAAAARGAQDPAAVLGLVSSLRKARRHEELEPSGGDLDGLARRLLVASLRGDEESMVPLLSERALEDFAVAELVPQEDQHSLRTALQQNGTSIDMVIDFVLAGLQVTGDGDDSLGYRVRTSMRFGEVQGETVFYAAREKDELRVVAGEELPVLGAAILRQLEAEQLTAVEQHLDWARDAMVAPSAEDPFSAEPFLHFWGRGSDRAPESARLAAASLMTRHPNTAEKALAILEEAYERAAAEDRRPVELALVRALARLERHEEVLSYAGRWVAESPDSEAAFSYQQYALRGLERWGEIERAATQRLELLGGDAFALGFLNEVARQRGDLGRQDELHRRAIELGKASSTDYNNLAWNAVVRGEVSEQTLADAQQAVAMSRGGNASELNTLAAVLAELDRGAEAREILLQELRVAGLAEPEAHDWYVIGRIAESYGVTDAAADAYRRVEPPEDERDAPLSSYRIAQRHLARLAGG